MPRPAARIAEVVALAAVYAAAGYVGFRAAIPPGNVTPVWPPSGIALAALLLAGRRLAPGVWAGSVVANLLASTYIPAGAAGPLTLLAVAAVIGVGSTLQALAGVKLTGRADPLGGVRAALRLVFGGGLLACAISPTVGVTALWAGGLVPAADFPRTWLTWWLGDTAGVLVVAPAVLAWGRGGRPPATPAGVAEGVVFALLLAVTTEVVLPGSDSLVFLALPFTVWAALRFGARGATLIGLAVSARAVAAVVEQHSPFLVPDPRVSLLLLQTFIGTVTVSTLLLVAVAAEREAALGGLRALNAGLEREVAARTAELAAAVDGLTGANAELRRRMDELLTAHRRADRVFAALADTLPGTVLDGRYRLDEKVGTGGFGVVFRAVRVPDGRPVAVKVFQPQPGNDSADASERFLREGVWAARVRHPHAVEVLDFGVSAGGIAYLVMELLDGRTLSAELKSGPLPPARCAAVLLPVCAALEAAHAKGIVHRDVKPENVFLHRGPGGAEVVKLIDFGLAKSFGPEFEGRTDGLVAADDDHTAAGHLVGTPLYMAPERRAARPCDARADVYSLGVVWYVMLCGRDAAGRLPTAADTRRLDGRPRDTRWPSVRATRPDVPAAVDDAIARMLDPDPDRRPGLEDVRRALAGATPA